MNSWAGKKVLVFGLGLNQGGVGSAKFFASSKARVRITDLRDKKTLKPSIDQLKKYPQIEYSLGGHKKEDIEWADLIIKNPAVKPGNEFINFAIKKGKRVEQDMGIFLDFAKPSQIIGVTGTKGKSTTATLIYEVLKKFKKNVIFAGNIGKSVLDAIPYAKPDSLIVLELSSFQLDSFGQHKVSPKWAVVTNITPDHLNYYPSMKEYVAAKRIIGQHQTAGDFIFLRKDDPVTTKQSFLKEFKGKIIYFSKGDLPESFKPALKGEHNLENMSVAFHIAKTFRLSEEKIFNTLVKFKRIPFRMELVKTWQGVHIINDTAATSPESATKAIQTYPGSIVIAGGMNKGMRYKEFVKILEKNAKKVFFLIGDSTDEIKKLMKKQKLIAGTYDNLEKLLKDVKKNVKEGDVVLFSPGATSFNLFNNEFDRGRKFNRAVERVFK